MMLPDRIDDRIRVGAGGCWLWTGYCQPNGYGQTSLDGHRVMAHRAVYTLLVGPIPDGIQLDHLCRVRSCVNPEHLDPVTQQENIARGEAGQATGARHRAKTHCPQGHPYDEANTRIRPNGHRTCRTCERDRMRRHRADASAMTERLVRALHDTRAEARGEEAA